MAMNEMLNPILPPLTMRNKSKIEKVSHLIESKLENLVSTQKKPLKNQKLLNRISLAILIVTVIISYVAICAKKTGSQDEKETYVLIKIFLMCALCFCARCASGNLRNMKKYECRRHFTDIGKTPIAVNLAFAIFYITDIIYSLHYEVTGLDLCSFIGYIVAFILSSVSILVACQESTKLAFDPCEDNHLYKLVSSMSKDKGCIRIVESSVFKIILQNIGSEIWNSDTFILHRHTGTCQKGECIKFNLPQFSLLPQQQIDLIPETFEYKGDCVRVPNFHCFGLRDRFDQVKTFITDKKGLSCHKTDGEGTTSCTCYTERISELVVTYNKSLWTNVTVY